MPLALHPLLPTDIPLLAPLYLAAFSHDSISLRVFPRNPLTLPSIDTWWTATNAADYRTQPEANFLKVVDTETPRETSTPEDTATTAPPPDSQGKIIAYAKWNIPVRQADGRLGGGGGGDDPDALPEWADGTVVELADRFFGELARRRRAIMGEAAYCYLEIVATLPEHQGRGAARQMIRWGLQRADELEVPCYLEANVVARPIYERYGFRVVGEFAMEDVGHVEYFMVREAKRR